MSPKEFAELDGQEQSLCVATYEAHAQIESIAAEQSGKSSEPVGNKDRPRTAASAAARDSFDN